METGPEPGTKPGPGAGLHRQAPSTLCGIMVPMRPRLALLLLLLPPSLAAQQPGPEALFDRAVEAQRHGEYAAAIEGYQRILKAEPGRLEARANLAVALAHEGRLDEAIAQYLVVVRAVPGDSDLRMNLGIAYYKKGDFRDAGQQFAEVAHAHPVDARLATLLGDSELHLGQAAEAVALMTPLEADNSTNPDFEYVLGSALAHSGHRTEAVERLERVATATSSADAYMLAGSTLMDMRDFSRARSDLDHALALNPGLAGLHTLDGMAKDMSGEAAEAEPVLREAVRRDPADFNANLYLGAILLKRRAMDEARSYLDRTLKINPSSPTARYELAMWQSTSGHYEEAAHALEELERSDPAWLEPHVELATVYYRLHRPTDGAREREIVARMKADQQSQGPPGIGQP